MNTKNFLRQSYFLIVALLTFFFLIITQESNAVAIEDLKQEIKKAKGTAGDSSQLEEKLKIAEEAVVRGEKYLEARDKQIDALKNEKAELEKLQLTLTSGLIGAIVTAIVAILGVLLKTFSSQSDKHLKQLEIIEKMAALKGKGVRVPVKFEQYYK